jgi:hypothetical protein
MPDRCSNRGQFYQDLAVSYFDTLDADRQKRQLVRCLEPMGYRVNLQGAA